MISWHKPGQKVVCITKAYWLGLEDDSELPPNAVGDVLTISSVDVAVWHGEDVIGLEFEERGADVWFNAAWFAPVYPDIIDQLRNFDAPVPGEPVRVMEEV